MFSKEEGCIFFRTPLAKVKVEEGGGEIFYGFRFVDIKDNHVWLEVGTNYDDSYYPYCVLLANEMNSRYHLSKEDQYHFYLNSINPKKKRFSKWASSKKDKDIELISEYYNINLQKAQGIRSLLSEDELDGIRNMLNRGGTKK